METGPLCLISRDYVTKNEMGRVEPFFRKNDLQFCLEWCPKKLLYSPRIKIRYINGQFEAARPYRRVSKVVQGRSRNRSRAPYASAPVDSCRASFSLPAACRPAHPDMCCFCFLPPGALRILSSASFRFIPSAALRFLARAAFRIPPRVTFRILLCTAFDSCRVSSCAFCRAPTCVSYRVLPFASCRARPPRC